MTEVMSIYHRAYYIFPLKQYVWKTIASGPTNPELSHIILTAGIFCKGKKKLIMFLISSNSILITITNRLPF